MERSGAQPIQEQRRPSVDEPFLGALKDEKDPAVRGYLENLRGQIAAIAAKHGANARDVWSKEFQANATLGEMEAINGLFKRIKAISERKITTSMAREIRELTDEREQEAIEMIAKAASSCPNYRQVVEKIAMAYLRDGFEREAWHFVATHGHSMALVDTAFKVRMTIAKARSMRDSEPRMSMAFLRNALSGVQDFFKSYREEGALFFEAYDAYCSLLDDAELAFEATRLWSTIGITTALAAERLAIELENRGMDAGSREMLALRVAIESDAHEYRSEEPTIERNLCIAEMRARFGKTPQPFLERAAQIVRELLKDVEQPLRAYLRGAVGSVARTAARLGRMNLCEEMGDLGLPIPTNVWDRIVDGCVDAGNLDKAEELLETKIASSWQKESLAETIVRAALLKGDFVRVERVLANVVVEKHELKDEIRQARVVARARRGERFTEDAWDLASDFKKDSNHFLGDEEIALYSAAIAALAFARGMREQIGKRE